MFSDFDANQAIQAAAAMNEQARPMFIFPTSFVAKKMNPAAAADGADGQNPLESAAERGVL